MSFLGVLAHGLIEETASCMSAIRKVEKAPSVKNIVTFPALPQNSHEAVVIQVPGFPYLVINAKFGQNPTRE